ncbi:hypothetical protein Pfo_030931 [Paulownia fortunei]|nr:hypothetical protein Pfo_030931 [Paulownia fortunei]
MLLYNLGAQQTESLIHQLGYQLPDDWLAKNTAYYLDRTNNGSTTSRPVFAGIYVELARQDAIGSDYYDIQGGTTAEGVHMGVMGETLSVIQNDYAGVDLLHGQFTINPRLPKQWAELHFTQQYRGALIDIDIKPTVINKRLYIRFRWFITDTAKFHEQAWHDLATSLNVPWSAELGRQLKGISRMDSLNMILAEGGHENDYTDDEKSAFAAQKNQHYVALIQALTPSDILPGMTEFLAEIKREGYVASVASASKNAPTILKKLGIMADFVGIVDPATLSHGKPDPEIFTKAGELLKLQPTQIIGLEDASAGVQAIKVQDKRHWALVQQLKRLNQTFGLLRPRKFPWLISQNK